MASLPADFTAVDKFSAPKSYTMVKFGANGKVLETELNEMQKIMTYRDLISNKLLIADGFINMSAMSLASGVLTIQPDTIVIGGSIHEILEPMTISVSTGDNVYVAATSVEVAGATSLKKSGNLSGGTVIANDILDSRMQGLETTRRVQEQVQLVKSNTGSAIYIPVATITSATAFTDKRTKCFMNMQDANHKLVTDAQITSWTNTASNYATHAADNGAHSYYGGATTGSTANEYLVSTTPAPMPLLDGDSVRCKIHADSTGNATLNWNGTGEFPIWDSFKNPVSNLLKDVQYTFTYEANNKVFILQGRGGGGDANPQDVLIGKKYTSDKGPGIGTMPNQAKYTGAASTYADPAKGGTLYVRIPQGAYLTNVDSSGHPEITVSDPNFIAANIKSGANILGIPGTASVVDTADATAAAGQILSGYSAYVNGAKVTGSIVDRGNYQFTGGLGVGGTGTAAYIALNSIPEGYYHKDSYSWAPEVRVLKSTLASYLGISSSVLKSGATVLDIAGATNVVDTTLSTGAAAAQYMLTGYSAFVNGAKVTGTIPNKGATTYTPGTTDQTIAAGQYLSGAQTVKGDANLVSGNIKSGVTIFGVTGNSNVVDTSAGTAAAAQVLTGYSAYVDGAQVNGTMIDRSKTGDDTVRSGDTRPISHGQSIYYGSYGSTSPSNKLIMKPPTGYYSAAPETESFVYAEAADVASVLGITSDKVKAGVTIASVAGKASVVDTADATAAAAKILTGYSAYVNGAKVVGTMADRANGTPANSYAVWYDTTFSLTKLAVRIPTGAYLHEHAAGETEIQVVENNLVSANIKAGTTIFGLAGKASVVETSDANASAQYILTGYSGYVNGTKINGSMPNKGAATYTPTTSDQTIAAAQYISGVQTIKGDANLVSANIKAGVSIFGVAGNNNVVDTSAGTAVASQILSGAIAYIDGAKVTGSMVNNAAETVAADIVILTNMILNGDYEDGTGNWAVEFGGGTLSLNTTGGKFGAKAAALKGNASNSETAITYPNISYVPGHVYYASCWVSSDTAGKTSELYFPYNSATNPNSLITCATANTWYRHSLLVAVSSTNIAGNYKIRLDNNNAAGTGTMLFDGVMVIDLTAAFGAGKEPTKAQMDAIINTLGGWFDGSTLVNKIPVGAYINNGATGGPDILANDPNLITNNIKAGSTIFGIAGKSSVVETSDANAAAQFIVPGYSGYVNGTKVSGSMPIRGGTGGNGGSSDWWAPYDIVYTANKLHFRTTQDSTTIVGYQNSWLSAAQADVASTIGLTSAMLKAGTTVLGVAGATNVVDTTLSTGGATAQYILTGYSAFVNGAKVNGTMVNKGAATYTPTTSDQTIAAAQYLSGAQTIKGDVHLVSANIKAGVSIFGVSGNSNVVDTSAGTAVASQILSGAIAFVDGAKVTGTIPSKAAATYTPTTSDQTIGSGQYLSGAQTVKGDANLVSANIKAGVSIFGVAGNSNVVDTSAGTATAAQIFSGAVAYVDGAKLTGTMPNNPAEVKVTRTISALNLISDGSFEDGSTWFWKAPTNGGTLGIGSAAKFGSKSMSLKGNTSYDETYVGTANTIPYVQGHKYYCATWVRSDTANTETQIYWPEVTPYPTSYLTCVAANTWYRNSFISADSTIVSGNYAFRLDNNNKKIASTVVFDGVMLIDLTASFGAGNEPTLTQMDALVDALGGWFDGTTLVNQIPSGAYVNSGTLGGPNILYNDPNLIPDNVPYNKTIGGIPGSGYGHGYSNLHKVWGVNYEVWEVIDWRYSPGSPVDCVDTDHWATRFVGVGNKLRRVDGATSNILFEYSAPANSDGSLPTIKSVAVDPMLANYVVIGLSNGKVTCLNMSGGVVWSVTLGSYSVFVKCTYDSKYVYCYDSVDGWLKKLNMSNGSQVWSNTSNIGIGRDFDVSKNGWLVLAAGLWDAYAYFINESGTVVRTIATPDDCNTAAFDSLRFIYLGSDSGWISKYSLDGTTLSYNVKAGATDILAIALSRNASILYVYSANGNIYIVRGDDGAILGATAIGSNDVSNDKFKVDLFDRVQVATGNTLKTTDVMIKLR